MTVLTGARVVTPSGVLEDGWVAVEGGTIAAVGSGSQPPPADAVQIQLDGGWVLPGFVDLHVHGGGGHDMAASPQALAAAVAFHRSHGTTRCLVSLVTAPPALLERQLGWVADQVEAGPSAAGHVVGAHLEGPFLSHARCGAQAPQYLLLPDRDLFARLVRAARGSLRSVTLAPELPGATALLRDVLDAGAVAAIGHTDATFDEAAAAFAAGATLTTHLFNAMRPVHHREPGAALAALEADVACEIINDGVHLHPGVVRLAARTASRLVLVTDAMDAAGVGDGDYVLGGQAVRVSGGQARLRGSGSLAGSTLTMDAAVRRAVLDVGLSVPQAAAAASTNPATVLGLENRCGAVVAGLDADLVVMDDDLRLVRVMAGGCWVER
jgi:N-acetylglucosamine-6-phosphate deacetylase